MIHFFVKRLEISPERGYNYHEEISHRLMQDRRPPMGRKQDYFFSGEPRKRSSAPRWILGIFLTAIVLLLVINYGVSHQVTYVRQTALVPDLPADLENYVILHLSDLHGETLGENQANILSAIGKRSFSCIVFTGDMVGEKGDVEPLLTLINQLPKDTPKLLIPGDSDPPLVIETAHDSLSVYASWAVKLQEAGVTILDEPVCFTRGKSRVWFVPEYLYTLDVDSTEKSYQAQLDLLNASVNPLTPDEAARKRAAEYQVARMQRIRDIKKDMKATDVQIAVTHAPLTESYIRSMALPGGDVFSLRNVSLILAGHYAGGQWRLPGLGALYVPEVGFFPPDEQIVGMDYISGIPQYISPGLAASPFYPLPGRLLNGPAVTCVTLSASIQ